jgi:NAD(P)-dependent dehydrogenase (short-subunit alcohol dehydrogenase family)
MAMVMRQHVTPQSGEWDPASIGDLRGKLVGKLVIVTGANSGIGFHTALELGRAGASVVVASRDPQRGQDAVRRMRAQAAHATVRFEQLDLADLASVRAFATRFLERGEALDC